MPRHVNISGMFGGDPGAGPEHLICPGEEVCLRTHYPSIEAFVLSLLMFWVKSAVFTI